MEKANSDEVSPTDPPAPASDPPPSRQSMATQLASGLAAGRARQAATGLAADRSGLAIGRAGKGADGASQGAPGSTEQGVASDGATTEGAEQSLAIGRVSQISGAAAGQGSKGNDSLGG